MWTEEEGPRRVCSIDDFLDLGCERTGFFDLLSGILCLEEAVETRQDFAIDVVNPEATVGAMSGIPLRQQWGTGVEVFQVFHQYGAFVAAPVTMLKSWDESTWIEPHELIGFLVRINLNVLVI